MKRVILTAFVAALVVHGAILAFGGLVLFHKSAAAKTVEEVDLVNDAADDSKKTEEKKAETKEAAEQDAKDASETLQQETPVAPDLHELQALEGPAAAPALSAMSLSDLEGALGGAGGSGGEFGGGFTLASGGRIGGTGAAGSGGGGGLDDILSSADLDQRPRPIFQASPQYPLELRKQKVEGTVNVVFFVDKDGRVLNPSVENSTHPAFERPALEAVRQWRFDPGTRRGEKVSFKMRVPISFHVS